MALVTRRTLLATSASVAAVLASPCILRARAAEFTFKAATNLAAMHPTNVRLQEASDRIRAETNGRLEIQVFPNSQLGGESDLLRQVRSGGVEIFLIGGLVISSVVPVAAINGTGFAFKDYDQVWKAMDGKLGAHVRAAMEKAGLYCPEKIWDLGFRQITSSAKPINTVEDLRGMKIRVPGAAAYSSLFKALGAAPINLQFPEVYSALQTKIADGQENPLALIATSKFYEVQKYCSLTNHIWDGFWVLINMRAWKHVPGTIQAITEKHLNESGLAQRADLAALDISVRDELTAKGLIINTTEPTSFRNKLNESSYYKEVRSKYGEEPWRLLEEYAGALG